MSLRQLVPAMTIAGCLFFSGAGIGTGASVSGDPFAGAAAARIKEAGLRTIGLVATAYTMEQDFYRDRLESHGLEVLVPAAGDRAEIQRIIFEELCLGRVERSSGELFQRVTADLEGRGAEGILLGCTELGIIIHPEMTALPLFDTTRIHAEALVKLALA